MPTPQDDRTAPPPAGDERAQLEGFLDYHRQTLLWKCAGLTDEQLRERPVPPSPLSLHGLVRHLADVERSWFRERFAGEDVPDLFGVEDNPGRRLPRHRGRGPGGRPRAAARGDPGGQGTRSATAAWTTR